jgi:hypothetical protein
VTDDDAVHEFGHAVAARLRRLPWFAERWPGPEDEMEGFTLFHEISRAADDQLKELLRAIPVEPREAENNVLERAALEAMALDWDQYGMAGEVLAQRIRSLKHER